MRVIKVRGKTIHGRGFSEYTDPFGYFRRILKGSTAARTVHRYLTNPRQIATRIIYGRYDDYPPSVKDILNQYGSQAVQSMILRRKVLSSIYTNIMSVWTKGETERRIKEMPKDSLYHISMIVTMANGQKILIEKNAAINMQLNPESGGEIQTQVCPMVPGAFTLGNMMDNARKSVGDAKFFGYSAKDNNCGNFIQYILKSNNIYTEAEHAFIDQDTKTVLAGFPSLRKVMNTITDIGARLGVLEEGGALKCRKRSKQKLHSFIH